MNFQNQSKTVIPVRYSETDAMGFVYYANFFVYFEVARTSALAELGFPYWQMEKDNILIPVLSAACEYKKPGRYGDALEIQTLRWSIGHARIRFDYRVLRGDETIAKGYTLHAFMHPEGRAIRPPEKIIALFPAWDSATESNLPAAPLSSPSGPPRRPPQGQGP